MLWFHVLFINHWDLFWRSGFQRPGPGPVTTKWASIRPAVHGTTQDRRGARSASFFWMDQWMREIEWRVMFGWIKWRSATSNYARRLESHLFIVHVHRCSLKCSPLNCIMCVLKKVCMFLGLWYNWDLHFAIFHWIPMRNLASGR